MKEKVTIIIPFLNEAENIPNLCQEVGGYCLANSHLDFEVIFVDDGSKDGSSDLLEGYQHIGYDTKLIKLSRNFGSHAALRAGILYASGDFTTFIYADLQDPLQLIGEMHDKAKKHDIVWATREHTEVSFLEKLFSRSYAKLMKKFAVPDFPENGFDIVMFNKKVQREINENIEANSSIFLQILSLGFRQTYITFQRRKRKVGKSKWTLSKKIKLFIDSFVAFSFAPIRLVTAAGVLFALAGFAWAIYIILRSLVLNDLQTGWPALISILMIGFGVTNISLGIIAEYLWRTLDASRKRKVFIIDYIQETKKFQDNTL